MNNLNILCKTFANTAFEQDSVNSCAVIDTSSSCENNVSLSSHKFTPDSSSLHVDLSMSEETNNYEFIPFEMLLTAGTVTIMLYYHEEHLQLTKEFAQCSKSTDIIPTIRNNSSRKMDFNSEQLKYLNTVGENNCQTNFYTSAEMVTLHPFLCLSIIQPHSYLLCHPSSQKFESSCFDLQLYGASVDNVLKSK